MPLKTWKEMRQEAEAAPKVSYEPLPAGPYNVRIEKAEHRPSSTGKDGYNVSAIVLNGPYEGRKIFNTFYVSPDSPTAMGIFFRHMDALGLPGEFFDSNPDVATICQALANRVAVFTVKQKEYNNVLRNELTNVSPADPAVIAAAYSGVSAGVPSASSGSVPAAAGPVFTNVPQTPQTPVVAPQVPVATPQVAMPGFAPMQIPGVAPIATPPANDPWSSAPPPTPPL